MIFSATFLLTSRNQTSSKSGYHSEHTCRYRVAFYKQFTSSSLVVSFLQAVYFLVISPNNNDRDIIVFVKSAQNIVFFSLRGRCRNTMITFLVSFIRPQKADVYGLIL
jgi:hypothetical protein